MAQQLPIAWEAPPSFDAAAFVVAPGNEAAHRLITAWPRWPAPALVLHGPSGSGKSHLGAIWARASGAAGIDARALRIDEVPSLLGEARAVLVEAADEATASPERERALLHLYNLLLARGGSLLLIAREPPALWPIALADLASRLRAALPVRIDAPDDALLGAVLRKLFADRQLQVSEEVIAAALVRMERSFAGAHALAAKLDYESLAQKRPVTTALLREVLAAL
jgi:chromosomal replication initiation ATPase DnaA